MVAANQTRKRKFMISNTSEFKNFLNNEEKTLTEFENVYQSLLNSIPQLTLDRGTELKLFNARYRIYEVATNL